MPDLGINLTLIFCCHLEVGKALEVWDALDALCFKEGLDPLDLYRVMLHRKYTEGTLQNRHQEQESPLTSVPEGEGSRKNCFTS